MTNQRTTLALVEKVILEDGKTYLAKIDTGADTSSIDEELLNKIDEEKEIIEHKLVRSSLGKIKKPKIWLDIEIKGQKFKQKFTVSNRSQLKFQLLIGVNVLKKGNFLVDPTLPINTNMEEQ